MNPIIRIHISLNVIVHRVNCIVKYNMQWTRKSTKEQFRTYQNDKPIFSRNLNLSSDRAFVSVKVMYLSSND